VINKFNNCGVQYLVVGGFAVNIYGFMRSTGDLDLWIGNDEENLLNTKNALQTMNYPEEDILDAIQELRMNQNINLIQDKYLKVELISFLSSSIDFQNVYNRREIKKFFGMGIPVISFDDLCDLKIKSGRAKDLMDVKELKRIRNK
jgi:hypothetical protein